MLYNYRYNFAVLLLAMNALSLTADKKQAAHNMQCVKEIAYNGLVKSIVFNKNNNSLIVASQNTSDDQDATPQTILTSYDLSTFKAQKSILLPAEVTADTLSINTEGSKLVSPYNDTFYQGYHTISLTEKTKTGHAVTTEQHCSPGKMHALYQPNSASITYTLHPLIIASENCSTSKKITPTIYYKLAKPLTCIAYNNSGDKMGTSIGSKTAVMNARTGKKIVYFGYTNKVTALCFAGTSQDTIVSGYDNGDIIVHNFRTSQSKLFGCNSKAPIAALTANANSNRIASITKNDKRVSLWDIGSEKSYTSITTSYTIHNIAFGPHGLLAIAGEKTVQLWQRTQEETPKPTKDPNNWPIVVTK